MNPEKVLIIDMGGSYTQLLARKIRERKVYSEILPCATSLENILARNAKALIITGGTAFVEKKVINLLDDGIFKTGLPILLIGEALKAFLRDNYSDYVTEDKNELLFQKIPEGFVIDEKGKFDEKHIVLSKNSKIIASVTYPDYNADGKILDFFLFNTAQMKAEWTSEKFIIDTVEKIKSEIPPNSKVVCGLSGGVDSVVSALLVHRAIGERLTCIFVDHGFMREGEPEQVLKTFRDKFKLKVVAVNASDEFIERLTKKSDPEEKRLIIGEHFINVFEREAKTIEGVNYLVQGTIYPDIIESISPSGETIKSHHNVGGLPEKMKLKLIEPVRELFKDEVRNVGKAMGLPDDIIWRQPFPGPGLAVRILGEITAEKISISRKANAIVEEEVTKAGLNHEIWQYFAVIPDIKSVGVSGDRRTYAYPVILRAVTSTDAMTAEWFHFPYEVIDRLSRRLVEEIPGVNRVVFDITSKPPATIEWE